MGFSFGRPAFSQEEQEGGQAEAFTGSSQEGQALHVYVSLHVGSTLHQHSALVDRRSPSFISVFPFGVNDPSVGNLSSEHAPWDLVASPAGWHAIPDSSNSYARQSIPGMKTGLKGPWVEGYEPVEGEMTGRYRNGTWSSFATTMGNNVFAQEYVCVVAVDAGVSSVG